MEKCKILLHTSPNAATCEFSVLIDEKNAIRVENWCNEAKSQGAVLKCGGQRQNNYFEPTVFTQTKRGMKIHDEEVFGPVVCLNSFSTIQEAAMLHLHNKMFSHTQRKIPELVYIFEFSLRVKKTHIHT